MLNCFHNQRHRNVMKIVTKYEPICVSDIRVEYCRRHKKDLTQPVFSVILADFRAHGLADYEKLGKFHFYSMNHEKLARIRGWVAKMDENNGI